MAPTTLNGFHHVPSEKTADKQISQIFAYMDNAKVHSITKKAPPQNDSWYAYTCNTSSGNQTSADKKNGDVHLLSRKNQCRPKDHDLFGASVMNCKDLKISKKTSAKETLESSKKTCNKTEIKSGSANVAISRPKDHDKSYLFGMLKTPSIDEKKPTTKRIILETRNTPAVLHSCLTKEKLLDVSKRPKDHDLFGEIPIVQNNKNLKCPYRNESKIFSQDLSEKRRPLSTSQRPKDHDIIRFCESAPPKFQMKSANVSKNESAFNNFKRNSIQQKSKVILNHPKDHDASYLFGVYSPSETNQGKNNAILTTPSMSSEVKKKTDEQDTNQLDGSNAPKNISDKPVEHVQLLQITGFENQSKEFLVKARPRSVVNRPKDHETSYLFGAWNNNNDSPCTSISSVEKNGLRNQVSTNKPKTLYSRPRDHDTSYFYKTSVTQTREKEYIKNNLPNENEESKTRVSQNIRELKPRVLINRPKDHDLFGTSIREAKSTIMLAENITEQKPRVILHRPKDHDSSYFFGNTKTTDGSRISSHPIATVIRGLQNLIPCPLGKNKQKTQNDNIKKEEETKSNIKKNELRNRKQQLNTENRKPQNKSSEHYIRSYRNSGSDRNKNDNTQKNETMDKKKLSTSSQKTPVRSSNQNKAKSNTFVSINNSSSCPATFLAPKRHVKRVSPRLETKSSVERPIKPTSGKPTNKQMPDPIRKISSLKKKCNEEKCLPNGKEELCDIKQNGQKSLNEQNEMEILAI